MNIGPGENVPGFFCAIESGMDARDSLIHIGEHARRWKLSGATLVAETSASRVYRVERKREGPAALKLLKPEAGDEAAGGDLLDWYGGQGAARVFALARDAVLMEWLEGPVLVEQVRNGGDISAAEIVCGVVSRLHAPRNMPPPRGLQSLETRISGMFAADNPLWPRPARDMLIRAHIIARQLLETTPEPIVLHGDIHHGNILGSPRGWLAIDPKGLLGDPAYELANCFINPWEMTELCMRMERIEALAGLFAEKLNLDMARILGFAVVHAVLSACWGLQAGNSIRHQLAILPRLVAAHQRAAELSGRQPGR